MIIKDGHQSNSDGYLDASSFGDDAQLYLIIWKNRFVMPDLMDMHVHLQFELSPKNGQWKLWKCPTTLVEMRSLLMFAMVPI